MLTKNVSTGTPPRRSARTRSRAVTVVAAPAATAVVWLATRLADADLTVQVSGQPPMFVGLPFALFIALAAALAGWGSLALMERLTGHARMWWSALAVGTLAVSFLPVMAADATTGTKASLALMHVAVAAVLITGLRRSPAR